MAASSSKVLSPLASSTGHLLDRRAHGVIDPAAHAFADDAPCRKEERLRRRRRVALAFRCAELHPSGMAALWGAACGHGRRQLELALRRLARRRGLTLRAQAVLRPGPVPPRGCPAGRPPRPGRSAWPCRPSRRRRSRLRRTPAWRKASGSARNFFRSSSAPSTTGFGMISRRSPMSWGRRCQRRR